MTLTEPDIDIIEKIVDERLDFKFPNLNNKIDQILKILSDLAGQFKGMQDEQTIQGKQLSEHEDRITLLEKPSSN